MLALLMKRPPLIALLCLLGGLSVNSQLSPGPPVSGFFRGLGILPIGMGIWLVIKAVQTFEQRGTTHKPEETPSTLITDGPMRVSRNPMYLGMAMLLAGIGWLMVSTPVMLSGLVFALIVQKYFILPEEETLKDLFGDEYMAYRSRVRRWL
jgi:protein-S-isoprenylcysteine O-methyltransferase Ste14